MKSMIHNNDRYNPKLEPIVEMSNDALRITLKGWLDEEVWDATIYIPKSEKWKVLQTT